MPRPSRQAPFTDLFVHCALVLSLTGGFGMAAALAAHEALGIGLERWWPVLVQVHGHVQIFGWLGLFIMGVSLYFLPRFAGVPLRSPAAARLSAALITSGLVGRGLAQVGMFAGVDAWGPVLRAASVAQLAGVMLYVALVLDCITTARPEREAFHALRLCFLSMLVGWVASTALIAWHSMLAVEQMGFLHPLWNQLGLDLFIGFVLLPVAFAFSIRTFPLYLRLPAVRWHVGRLVGLFLVGQTLQSVVAAAELVGGGHSSATASVLWLGPAGQLLKGVAILLFIWRLDLLTRRQPAWINERDGTPPEQPRLHRQPRAHLPDYGEFGHFEWHIYLAYAFLVLAAGLEVHSGAGLLSAAWSPVPTDALRHVYLAGFGTLLLLGMAPRMLPGFWRLRNPASARLIDVSFVLAASAAVLRVAPGLAPSGPWHDALQWGYGVSGLLGWLAVAALAINLWHTHHQRIRKNTSA